MSDHLFNIRMLCPRFMSLGLLHWLRIDLLFCNEIVIHVRKKGHKLWVKARLNHNLSEAYENSHSC